MRRTARNVTVIILITGVIVVQCCEGRHRTKADIFHLSTAIHAQSAVETEQQHACVLVHAHAVPCSHDDARGAQGQRRLRAQRRRTRFRGLSRG